MAMDIDRQLMLDLAEQAPPERIVGIDEVGRGPLAGPVVAAAVILPPDHGIAGIDDSKKLSEEAREALAQEIRSRALAWTIASASVKEIDQINILQASMLAMSRAADSLEIRPDLALVDGNRLPALPCAGQSVIKGDQRVECIAAASILAKVERDRLMRSLHDRFPGYDWAKNKGYPTRAHMQALTELGATPEHRRSFAPVRKVLE